MQAAAASARGATQHEARQCLIVCDMQPDALKSIEPISRRNALLDAVAIAIHVARKSGWEIIWTGLQFPKGYDGIAPTHKLYGALRRLNAKVGDGAAHWFMEGYDGSSMEPRLRGGSNERIHDGNNDDGYNKDEAATASKEDPDAIFWRQSHLPSAGMLQYIQRRGITEATVVGIKLSFAVQSTIQALCDLGTLRLFIVMECVCDDNDQKARALLDHFIPLYADVMALSQWVDQALLHHGGLSAFSTPLDGVGNKLGAKDPLPNAASRSCGMHLVDCGRAGHMWIFAAHLLRRENWRRYPNQPWYRDEFSGKSYICPLGKAAVAFCDEPRFSAISMYIKGREWLDEKEKVIQLEATMKTMPPTHHVSNGKWVGDAPDPAHPANIGVKLWFVKECDKNGGRAITVCHTIEECQQAASTQLSSSFVVQPHVANPLLTTDGRKCHLKMYFLIQCSRDGAWSLSSHTGGYLCVADKPWTVDDLSSDTQLTVLRTHRLEKDEACQGEDGSCLWAGWPSCYEPCQSVVAAVVDEAIATGKFQPRPDQAQFEIMAADFMLSQNDEGSPSPRLIEFNFGCVLFDPSIGQPLSTRGLRWYQEQYEKAGMETAVNDTRLISEALDVVFGAAQQTRKQSNWEVVFEGRRVSGTLRTSSES